MISVLHLENKLDDKTSQNRTRFYSMPMTQNKWSAYNIWDCLYPVCLIWQWNLFRKANLCNLQQYSGYKYIIQMLSAIRYQELRKKKNRMALRVTFFMNLKEPSREFLWTDPFVWIWIQSNLP